MSMQLGVMEQTISKRLHENGKDPKRRKMDSANSLKPTKINEWQRVFLFSISSIENFSCGKSLKKYYDNPKRKKLWINPN